MEASSWRRRLQKFAVWDFWLQVAFIVVMFGAAAVLAIVD